jgi:hypothetical protein
MTEQDQGNFADFQSVQLSASAQERESEGSHQGSTRENRSDFPLYEDNRESDEDKEDTANEDDYQEKGFANRKSKRKRKRDVNFPEQA